MTKVTFCVYDKPDSVGGPVTWIQRLIPLLKDRDIEPRCLFLLHWGDTGPALESLRAHGIDCKAITAPVRTEERIQWILECLREDPPDVLVPNLVVAGYFAGRWMREAGIPTVGVLHSDDNYYRAVQDEFVFGDPRYRVSSVVCVSEELERQVIDRGPTGVMVKRIPYGVPIPSESVTAPRDTMRIAYVGRLAQEQKRILDVTRTLRDVVSRVPGTEGVIYGDGPQREDVQAILADECAELPVRFMGAVPSDSIQAELLKCHAIMLLSEYEGLPIALLEAMACGSAPICRRMRSGVSELVEDGVSGMIVDRDADVIDAVRTLRNNDAIWKSFSRQARQVALDFSLDRSADMWAVFLNEMAESARSQPIRSFSRMRLPTANPALESPEQRQQPPGFAKRTFRSARMLAGKFRRRLLGVD